MVDRRGRRWFKQHSSARVTENKGLSSSSSSFAECKVSESSEFQPSTSGSSDGPFAAKALSAAGAAFISAVIMNPLDVVKTRLQAQAAGVPYSPLGNLTSRMIFFGPTTMFADLRCSPTCTRAGIQGTVAMCPPDCFQYKGTFDVLYKIVRQEGFFKLWRGTVAGLALAMPMVGIYLPFYDVFRDRMDAFADANAPSMKPCVPLVAGSLARSLACAVCYPVDLAKTRMQAFKETGQKPPGVWKTLLGMVSTAESTNTFPKKCFTTLNKLYFMIVQSYRVMWTGLGAQLARDVPFSAICWATMEPIRKQFTAPMGDEKNVATVLGANFSAALIAGSIAAVTTCPLDVARTRRQIEKEPQKALRMTTKQTLVQVWRDGGMKGLFAGVGPRVARAGPSVGIVISFYEVVKHVLHRNLAAS